MPNINDAFPSQYLKAADLAGHEPIVTIKKLDFEPVGRDKEMKPILYFDGKAKGLVLNKTNAKRISDLVGSPETDDWPGCKIRLYATETEFAGETVDCIRIKAVGAATTRAMPAPAAERPPKAASVAWADAPPEPSPTLAPRADDEDEIPF